jgi:hypothetical protein
MAFGSAIAVTIVAANGATGELIDADVLFDGGREWSTYPGSPQSDAIDFHRVAIHEFGHVLGLAHPDDAGQSVIAIMNSRVSDIDSLQADDIAGVNAIYPVVTSPSSVPGTLENPQPNSFVSGVSVISGWVCTANRVDIQIDGVLFETAYGTARADTLPVCGDEENGFSLLVNWNLFGDGGHLITALADRKEIARATFTVTTFEGQEFLAGASGRYRLPNFAGHNVIIKWEESLQNFVIIDVQ